MLEVQPMPKDLMFKLRLDEDDRKRLDDLSGHYSAPAATVVRILIKEKHEQLKLGEPLWWYRFVKHVNELLKLSELKEVQLTGDQADGQIHLKDEKRERIVSNETEAFVVLNNWPHSQLSVDADGHLFNKRTGKKMKSLR